MAAADKVLSKDKATTLDAGSTPLTEKDKAATQKEKHKRHRAHHKEV